MQHRSNDPWALTSVRIEPHLRSLQESHGQEHGTPVTNASRYKRIIPVLETLREKVIGDSQDRPGSVSDGESVYETPAWKTENLGDWMPEDRSSALEQPVIDSDDESEKLPVPTQVGDALKGTTDDDKLTQPIRRSDSGTVSNFRRKLKSKRPRLFSMSSRADSWDEVQPPLTALGADDGDEKGGRQNVMLSGHVAVGLAQAGAALASTAGGAIGKNILVQLVEKESERLHNMLHSGLSRVRTNEEIDYDQDTAAFIHGRQPSQQLRRRTRAKSSATS